ncbi:hypothetical protein ACH4L5_29360 [Streptomyces sp. NPDC017405]|uniref:hypothetical protein n=1 Tax=unclassified Streptomyces TaxID=2593676 RepID=UPI003796A5CE
MHDPAPADAGEPGGPPLRHRLPSGQPAAGLITGERAAEGHPATTHRPCVSPIVLGTYREYAETLQEAADVRAVHTYPVRFGDAGPAPLRRAAEVTGGRRPMAWWPAALAGLLVLGGPALRRGIARLGKTAADPGYLPLYLDNDAVMRLFKTGGFVMVTGRFEAGGGRGGSLVMRAPYAGGGPAAHLRVVLRGDGLLTPDRQLPEGQFQAHCLGKVTSWDPGAREVVLQYPVAVFR